MTAIISYTPNIPNPANKPSVDQPNMTINNNNILSIIEVDHSTFNQNYSGNHTVIHQITQGSDPVDVTPYNELYAKVANGDTQLFVRSPANVFSQLTGHLAATKGFQYIGGVLLNWGSQALIANQTLPQTFQQSYVGVPYSIVANVQSSATTLAANCSAFLTTGFTLTNGTAQAVTVNWIAIGH